MSTVLDEPAAHSSTSPAQRLRTTMAAVRVSLQWLGVRKTLTAEQKSQAADTFGAVGDYLSVGKKLLDTRHPSFKAVTAVKNKAVGFWKSLTLPFPEGGIRLIRQDRVEQFDAQMRQFQVELTEAVATLDRHYAELKSAARDRLGTLFNESDYPASLEGLFSIAWDFPSVEPPDYLQQLNPQLYEQECQRMQQRFDEAVRLAEAAFTAELAKVISHLTERLSGSEDGKPKVFRNSAIGNLTEFFERFKSAERQVQRAARRPGRRCPADRQRRRAAAVARQRGVAAARRHRVVAGTERAGRPTGRSAAPEHPSPAQVGGGRHAASHQA